MALVGQEEEQERQRKQCQTMQSSFGFELLVPTHATGPGGRHTMGPPPPPAHWLSNPSRQEGPAPPGQPRSTRPRERARCHLLTDSGIVLPIPEKFQRSAQLHATDHA
eukprot:COSAG06_NODE_8650_length_2106_cov_15.724464_3_plen_108_part_00